MSINSTADVDLEAVNNLAEQQVECLTGDASCLDPLEVPGRLLYTEGARPHFPVGPRLHGRRGIQPEASPRN
jgi:hypothetical protein